MKANLKEITAAAKIMGVVFYHSPAASVAHEVISALSAGRLASEWPVPADAAFALLSAGDAKREALEEAYYESFIGPGERYVPLWGSVFLDNQNLMNGNSTIALKDFLREAGICTDTGINEPEDHIALMMFIAAALAERDDEALLAEFLSTYMLSWCYRYFDLLGEKTSHEFYKGLALLASTTVKEWEIRLNLVPEKAELYL